MSWFGAGQNFNKVLKENREARQSQRKIDKFSKVELGKVALDLKKEPLTDKKREEIQLRIKQERKKTWLKLGLLLILLIFLFVFIYLFITKE